MLTLAEELFLLSLREKKKNIGFSSTFALTYSMAGALMAELALDKKVTINSEKKVIALDASTETTPCPGDAGGHSKLPQTQKTLPLDRRVRFTFQKASKQLDGCTGGQGCGQGREKTLFVGDPL